MPEIEIRPAVLADFQFLKEIEQHNKSEYVWQMDRSIQETQVTINFREVRLPRSIRIENPQAQDILAEFTNKGSGVLSAWLEGVPVGYICFEDRLDARTVWVRGMAVAERHRCQGIGSALVLAAQDWAISRGLRRMVIEMHSKNYPAIRMAIKLGLEFSGYHDQYYANQDIALFFSRLLR
jgi:GNAT superfamily N-acetyltransferase